MTTPNNREQTRAYTEAERNAQRQLDMFYKNLGQPILRQPTKQYDLILDGFRVEEKIRFSNPNSPNPSIRNGNFSDFLIEIMQDIVTNNPGWFYTTDADKLHYILCQYSMPKILYVIEWDSFKKWFLDDYLHQNLIGKYVISIKGYGLTLNISVPISEVPVNLYKPYNLIKQLMFLEAK